MQDHGAAGGVVLRAAVQGQQGLHRLDEAGQEGAGPARPAQAHRPAAPPRLPGQVLPRGRVGGAGAGGHPAPLLPPDQGPDPQHEDLLPARGQRAAGKLRGAGQGGFRCDISI